MSDDRTVHLDDLLLLLKTNSINAREAIFGVPFLDECAAELAALRALNAEAMDVLAEIEWHFNPEYGRYYCPECHNNKDYGHMESCKLNALLQRTTSEGSQP